VQPLENQHHEVHSPERRNSVTEVDAALIQYLNGTVSELVVRLLG